MYLLMQTFRDGGLFAFLQLAVFVGGGLWALVCAVLLGLRRRVPPVIAAGPLMVVPLLVGVGAMVNYEVTGAVAAVDPAMRATLLAGGIAAGLAQGWFGLLVVPVAVVLGLGGLAAGIRGPRAWGVPALVFLVAGATAVLPIGTLFTYSQDAEAVLARVLVYGCGALPLALATASAHRKSNGPEGGMVAAAAWVSVVGAIELALLTANWSGGFSALAVVSSEQKLAMLAHMVDEVGRQTTFAWVLLGLASIPALICAFRPGPPPTEEEIMAGDFNPSPGRSLGRFFALAVVPLWAFAFVASSPESALEAIASMWGR